MLTVPYAAQQKTIKEIEPALEGKILIDATVPLAPPKVSRVQLPGTGSAVAAVQQMLRERVRVVSAFQNVSAHHLNDLSREVECDVIVCGNDRRACDVGDRACLRHWAQRFLWRSNLQFRGGRGPHLDPDFNQPAL